MPPARTDLTPVVDEAEALAVAEAEAKEAGVELPEPPTFKASAKAVPAGHVVITVPSEVAKTVVKVLDDAVVDLGAALNQALEGSWREVQQTRLDRIQKFTTQARAALLREDLS